MAQNKRGFILYADLLDQVEDLDNETIGKLLRHILEYVNDRDPAESDDIAVKFLFRPIKSQLKRDLEKWASTREKRSKAGKKGGLAKASNAKQNVANLANVAVNVTDTVNVTVNDNPLGLHQVDETKPPISESFNKFWSAYNVDENRELCEREWSLLSKQERDKATANAKAFVNNQRDRSSRFKTKPLTYLKNKRFNDSSNQKQGPIKL